MSKNGGPAFPSLYSSQQPGMLLRDYFAAQAMQGLIADGALRDNAQRVHSLAALTYQEADAMLKAREA